MGIIENTSLGFSQASGSGYNPLTDQIAGAIPRDATTSPSSGSGSSSSSDSSDFASIINSIISPDANGNVSEQELFAGVVGERISTLEGSSQETQYVSLLQQAEQSMSANGYTPYEAAAKSALSQMVSSGDVSSTDADTIFSEAFNASQLITKPAGLEALFDSVGGNGDPTLAVASISDAIASAQQKIEGYDAGTQTYTQMSLSDPQCTLAEALAAYGDTSSPDSASTGDSGSSSSSGDSGGSGGGGDVAPSSASPTGTQTNDYLGGTIANATGFYFNPISADGSLSITLPSDLTGVTDVKLINSLTGKVAEKSTKVTTSDGQSVYSFKHAGGAYPINLNVQVDMSNGTSQTYFVPDPSLIWN